MTAVPTAAAPPFAARHLAAAVSEKRGRRRALLAGLAAWSAVALIWMLDIGLQRVDRDLPFVGSPRELGLPLAFIAAGLLLTPPVFLALGRVTAVPRPLAAKVAAYVGVGVGFWLAWCSLQVALVHSGLPGLEPPPTGLGGTFAQALAGMGFNSAILFAVMVGVHEAHRGRGIARREELRLARLGAELAVAETAALQARLQPHFLFNTLHVASGLMNSDLAAARRVLHDLAALLRHSIGRADRQLVALRDEIELVKRYVAIQKARYADRLDVRLAVDDQAMACAVPPLVLQPLVENALRHGIEPHVGGGRVEIEASRQGDSLQLTVRDDGGAGEVPLPVREGIGLGTTRERLRLLFGERAGIAVAGRSGGGLEVTVTLPWGAPPSAAPARQVPTEPADDEPLLAAATTAPRYWLAVAAAWLAAMLLYVPSMSIYLALHGHPLTPWQARNAGLMVIVGGLVSVPMLFLVRRAWSASRSPAVRAGLTAALGVGYWLAWSFAMHALYRFGVMRSPRGGPGLADTLGRMAFNALVLFAVIASFHAAVTHLGEARRRRLQAARVARELARAHALALRSRLRPELLFATLHLAAGLMGRDVLAARKVLADLGELLRAALGPADADHVALGDELRLANRWVDIERARRGAIDLRVEVAPEAASAAVPPLFLQPLIAEALPPLDRAYQSPLRLDLSATTSGATVRVRVIGSAIGEPGDAVGRQRPAVGEAAARLRLLHGEDGSVVPLRMADGRRGVEITLPATPREGS